MMTENEIGKVVVDAAIEIHKALGSGVYEIVYEVVLTHELKKHCIVRNGFNHQSTSDPGCASK